MTESQQVIFFDATIMRASERKVSGQQISAREKSERTQSSEKTYIITDEFPVAELFFILKRVAFPESKIMDRVFSARKVLIIWSTAHSIKTTLPFDEHLDFRLISVSNQSSTSPSLL